MNEAVKELVDFLDLLAEKPRVCFTFKQKVEPVLEYIKKLEEDLDCAKQECDAYQSGIKSFVEAQSKVTIKLFMQNVELRKQLAEADSEHALIVDLRLENNELRERLSRPCVACQQRLVSAVKEDEQ